jgi:hypothetical protein
LPPLTNLNPAPETKARSRGKYTVVVGGRDDSQKHVDSDGMTHTKQLFQDYRFEVEIPPPNNTLGIEVPASQALGGAK